jgi:hypothetical protein
LQDASAICVEKLYQQQAFDSPAVDDWLDYYGADIDGVRAFGPTAGMRGSFMRYWCSAIYECEFIPDSQENERAVVMPVIEEGGMVDVVAWHIGEAELDVWMRNEGAQISQSRPRTQAAQSRPRRV